MVQHSPERYVLAEKVFKREQNTATPSCSLPAEATSDTRDCSGKLRGLASVPKDVNTAIKCPSVCLLRFKEFQTCTCTHAGAHTNSCVTLAMTHMKATQVDGWAESRNETMSDNKQRRMKSEYTCRYRRVSAAQALLPALMTRSRHVISATGHKGAFPRILRGSHASCIIISSHLGSSPPSVSHNSSLCQQIVRQSLPDKVGLTH